MSGDGFWDSVGENERWHLTSWGWYVDEKEKQLLIDSLRLKRDERLLVVKCGDGRLVKYFSEVGLKCFGVEEDPEKIKDALDREALTEETIIAAKSSKLPFADSSFDAVVFVNTLENEPDKEAAIREALRVSKSRVGIIFLNKFGITNYMSLRTRKLKGESPFFFTQKSLAEAMKRAEVFAAAKKVFFRYTLFLPMKVAHLFPPADTLLEKTNIPFGNVGAGIIIKKEG